MMLLPFVCFLFTAAVYWMVQRTYKNHPKIYFTPLLLTPLIVAGGLVCTRVPYRNYMAGAHWISDMIGPATVALAVPIYKNLPVLKKHAVTIVSSVLFGSTFAILTSAGFAKLLNLNNQLIESVAPRSATTPIAMAASQLHGGLPTITAILVMMTGLMGMIIGPWIIRLFGIRNDVAKGVLFGTGAHAAGTAKAFEFGTEAGSVSSIAMILTAFFTFATIPWVMSFVL